MLLSSEEASLFISLYSSLPQLSHFDGEIAIFKKSFPPTDGRMLEMRRYSQPEVEHKIILDKLRMNLPKQPPPKIYSRQLNKRFCGGN